MKINMFMIAGAILLFYACKEEERGQYPVESGAPSKVTSARVVENTPGGATIAYDYINEKDVLYVKASYTLDDGTPMELKASAYTNTIDIVGIGKSREVPVSLTVVDRSRNESEAVTVVAHPLDSPIYELANSIAIKADFGGIRLVWDNPTKTPVTIDVFVDEDDELIEVERFYSDSPYGKSNVRGREPEETDFAVVVRDRWGNSTDLRYGCYTPLFEQEIDKSKFRRWNPPALPYMSQSAATWKDIENLWDDTWYPSGLGFAGTATYMTFDLGQVAKISRFKLYARGDQSLIYNHVMPKRFEMWGSLTTNVTDDFDTWQFLGYFESYKPSGLPLGTVSNEDIQYAAIDGMDFEIEAAPDVRYIRFQTLETYNGTIGIQLMEISFFGEIQQ